MQMRQFLAISAATLLLSGAAIAQTNPALNSTTNKPGSGATGGSDTVPQTMHKVSPSEMTAPKETLEQQKERARTANQRAIGSSNPAHTPSGGGSGGTTGGSDTVPKSR